MVDKLTMMAVHAHPDDESSGTGGVLAKYSAEGIRTVVVTCTNGEYGDAPGKIKPGEPGHEEAAVAKIRLAELRTACDYLGVSDLEILGYHDSGMSEWDYKDHPDVFSNVPLDVAAARIAGLIEKYRPQVVITYDDNGGYDHPDHLHASRAAVAAVSSTGIPAKLYLTAMRRSRWADMWQA
ncbi:MAG: PIG-L family deacetylase, partial [Actinomycetota bacterium]